MKKILYIVPYKQLFPPINGGMLRNYFLSYELSQYSDLTLLVLQPVHEFVCGENGYKWDEKIKFVGIPNLKYNQNIYTRIKYAILGRYYQRSFFQPANDFILKAYPALKKLLKKVQFDIVIFAHLESLSLAPLVKSLNPSAFTVFDAHNVDHVLFHQNHDMNNIINQKYYKQLRKNESTLYKKVNIFICCSEIDRLQLINLNRNLIKGYLVPNGANTNKNIFHFDKDTQQKALIFCGTLDYIPNLKALIWFFERVWPIVKTEIPELKLTIIGRNGNSKKYDPLKKDPDINFIGDVDDVTSYYYNNNIAIVPLNTGSGTRLKILEAMSLGNAVVSTSVGAEGIIYQSGHNIIIADNENDFSFALIQLLSSSNLCEQIRKNARKLIDEFYSWEIIGKNLFLFLENIKSTRVS
jgi:glycosyltransferase involved in cell wall biosynthesis